MNPQTRMGHNHLHAEVETPFRKGLRYSKWILPPVAVGFAAVIGIDKIAASIREYATREGELALISYYAPRFKIIAGTVAAAIVAGAEYFIHRYFSRD